MEEVNELLISTHGPKMYVRNGKKSEIQFVKWIKNEKERLQLCLVRSDNDDVRRGHVKRVWKREKNTHRFNYELVLCKFNCSTRLLASSASQTRESVCQQFFPTISCVLISIPLSSLSLLCQIVCARHSTRREKNQSPFSYGMLSRTLLFPVPVHLRSLARYVESTHRWGK